MNPNDVIIAVFNDHLQVDAAVRKLIDEHFDMKQFSVVGKGYHTEEKIVGLYTMGDRMKLWGKYGAFWGGLWGLLFGGLFLTIPVLGPIVALGPLAAMIVAAVEGSVVVGTLSALGSTLVDIGLPVDKAVHYEAAIQANGFIVMAHGASKEMARAKALLTTFHPAHLDWHEGVTREEPVIPATF